MNLFEYMKSRGTSRHSLPYHVPSAPVAAMMSPVEIEIAIEKADRGAELIFIQDPGKLRMAEDLAMQMYGQVFRDRKSTPEGGMAHMRERFPEAYRSTSARFIDNFSWPWR